MPLNRDDNEVSVDQFSLGTDGPATSFDDIAGGGYSLITSGTATLSGGSAVVSTGVTTVGSYIDARLDPSGDGANSSDVKVRPRYFWDDSAGEYKVEIVEDGTSVGGFDVGYQVWGRVVTPTVLVDHEAGGAVTDYYAGQTSGYTISNLSTLEGSYLLESTDEFQAVGYNATSLPVTERGNTYKVRFQMGSSGNCSFIVGAQDPADPLANCYRARIVEAGNNFILEKRSTTSGNSDIASNYSTTTSTGTEYRIEFEYGTGGSLAARLLDSSDTLIRELTATHSEHSGGTFGYNNGSGTTTYFDYVTETTV